MSARTWGRGPLAVLTGAALVVPLAVGATVIAAQPEDPAATPSPMAVGRDTSTAPEAGSATSPDAGPAAGAANAAAPVGHREPPSTSRRPAAAPEQAGSLAEVAGREAPASRAQSPRSGGLEQAAERKPENDKGARGRSGDAPDRTRGLTRRAAVAPDKVLDEDTAPGGCLAEYGKDGQCLPTVPPSLAEHVQDMEKAGQDVSSMPHHWDCAEVRTYFADGIAVREAGEDPQGLDADKDGVACGAGD